MIDVTVTSTLQGDLEAAIREAVKPQLRKAAENAAKKMVVKCREITQAEFADRAPHRSRSMSIHESFEPHVVPHGKGFFAEMRAKSDAEFVKIKALEGGRVASRTSGRLVVPTTGTKDQPWFAPGPSAQGGNERLFKSLGVGGATGGRFFMRRARDAVARSAGGS